MRGVVLRGLSAWSVLVGYAPSGCYVPTKFSHRLDPKMTFYPVMAGLYYGVKNILAHTTSKPVSKCSRRPARPGLKGPAEGAGGGKTGLTRNVTDVHILPPQQQARFGDACLIHDLRMRQVIICQPPLQRARADTQLPGDLCQRRMSDRQQLRYNVADFTDGNNGLAHGQYTFRDNPSFIVVTIIAVHRLLYLSFHATICVQKLAQSG